MQEQTNLSSPMTAKCTEIAEKYIQENMSDPFELDRSNMLEWDDFFYFNIKVKAPSQKEIWGGYAFHFIHKASERIFTESHYLDIADTLQKLRKDIQAEQTIRKSFPYFDLQKLFRLVISSIHKKQILIDSLFVFEPSYVIPETVGESIYRIPVTYSKKRLEMHLNELPALFHQIPKFPYFINELLKNQSCTFTLEEYEPKSRAKYTNQASEVDYQPIW